MSFPFWWLGAKACFKIQKGEMCSLRRDDVLKSEECRLMPFVCIVKVMNFEIPLYQKG